MGGIYKCRRFKSKDNDRAADMGQRARKYVEKELNPEEDYKRLMEIYGRAFS